MSLVIPLKASGKPVKPYGVAWYETASVYEAMQAACADMHQATYEEWKEAAQSALGNTQEGEQGVRSHVPVLVETEPFLAWCVAQKRPPDAGARSSYVYTLVETEFEAALRAFKNAKKNSPGAMRKAMSVFDLKKSQKKV